MKKRDISNGRKENNNKEGQHFTSLVRASETTETRALQVARMTLQKECNRACEDVLSGLRT